MKVSQLQKSIMSKVNKEFQFKQNLVGDKFIEPPGQSVRLTLILEILSLEDFDAPALFLKYKVQLHQGWQLDNQDLQLILPRSKEIDLEFNRLSSITQTASVIQHNHRPSAFLSFPIDLCLLANYDCIGQQWPVINFEVCSIDSWGINRVQGYGFIQIPKPGFHEMKIHTFKPITDLDSLVKEFYVGGSIRVKNYQKVSMPYSINQRNQIGPVNRSNYSTVSAGVINLRVNVALHQKSYRKQQRTKFKQLSRAQRVHIEKEDKSRVSRQREGVALIDTGKGLTKRYRDNLS